MDVLIPEDVWGPPFAELATKLDVVHEPALWAERPRLLETLHTARALVVRNRTQVDAELLAAAPALQVVGRAGVGLDNIDLEAADRHRVVVVAPAGVNARSVAEHTLALALGLARHVVAGDRLVRDGRWERSVGIELADRTWGVVGFGATGRAVASLATGLGMSVVAYDPYVNAALLRHLARPVPLVGLDELLTQSDVVSLHLPSTPETRGLFDADRLGRMRAGSLLINVGRGDVLDEAALAEALIGGPLGGAALDVRTSEPPGPGPLDRLDNVILTPHVAGITQESQERITGFLAAELDTLFRGGETVGAAGSVRRIQPVGDGRIRPARDGDAG